ncbi:MAG: plasmid mobilization relaxosome protein MobC [Gluconacetobacter sp.]
MTDHAPQPPSAPAQQAPVGGVAKGDLRDAASRRTSYLSIHVTPTERDAITAGFSHDGGRPYPAIRSHLLAVATVGGDERLAQMMALIEEIRATRNELARVGNNLNQIAYKLNSGGDDSGLNETLTRQRYTIDVTADILRKTRAFVS